MTGDAEGTAPGASDVSPVTALRFRHVPSGSGVSRSAEIRPGSLLAISYDPARLAPHAGLTTGQPDGLIVGHARFHPGGQTMSGPAAGLEPWEVRVPADATRLELWFQRRRPDGGDAWDSCYGCNYWFAVVEAGLPVPQPAVEARSAAEVDPDGLRLIRDEAAKQQIATGAVGSRLVTWLKIVAAPRDSAPAVGAWADVHLFDGADQLVHATTVPLAARSEGFAWEGVVYEGSGGGSGIGVTVRPDVHLVQYRLYAALDGRIVTNGLLYELAVTPDREGATPRARLQTVARA